MTTFRLALATLAGLAAINLARAADDGPPKCSYVEVASLPVRYVGTSLSPAVDGVINGSPATMLVDTGAYRTILTMTGAEKFNLSLHLTGRYAAGVSGNSRLYWTRLTEFSIGPTRTANRTELPVISQTSYTPPYDAIAGAPFLLQMDMEISLRDKRLKLFRPHDCDGVSLAYWNEPAIVVPFDPRFRDDPTPHITVLVNGQKMDAIIDTGAGHTALSLDAAKRAGIRMDAPEVRRVHDVGGVGAKPAPHWIAAVDSVSIGGETVRNAKLGIIDSQSGGGPDVYLGQDFLRAHRVLFAMSQQRVYLAWLGGDVFSQRTGIEPWIRQEADQGNADAQYVLGSIYHNGGEVPPDEAQARSWLDKAAAQGHAQANFTLGARLVQAGRYADAAARLRAALDKLPAERYGALWLFLARVRLGQAELGKRELEAGTAAHKDDNWPAPLADFYLGRISAGKLLDKASEDERERKARTCDANLYMAEWHAAHGDEAKASAARAAFTASCAAAPGPQAVP
jgi:predicted aspartyl protease